MSLLCVIFGKEVPPTIMDIGGLPVETGDNYLALGLENDDGAAESFERGISQLIDIPPSELRDYHFVIAAGCSDNLGMPEVTRQIAEYYVGFVQRNVHQTSGVREMMRRYASRARLKGPAKDYLG